MNTPLFLFCNLTLLLFKSIYRPMIQLLQKSLLKKKVADKGACLKKLVFKWYSFSKNLI